MRILPIGVLLAAFVAAAAHATLISPVSQARQVRATASSADGFDTDTQAASDFGPFDETASASVTGPAGDFDGSAFQTSVIEGNRVTADSQASADRDGGPP